MAADIPSVVLNQVATPEWANLVADGIDEHESRLDALEGYNLNSRLTTAEADITTVESWAEPVRSWRYVEFQPCGIGPHLITTPSAVWGDTNVSYSGGTYTIAKSGVYMAVAFVTGTSGVVTSVDWRLNGSSLGVNIHGTPHIWGAGAGDGITFWAMGSNSGTVITGGHIQLVRLSAP